MPRRATQACVVDTLLSKMPDYSAEPRRVEARLFRRIPESFETASASCRAPSAGRLIRPGRRSAGYSMPFGLFAMPRRRAEAHRDMPRLLPYHACRRSFFYRFRCHSDFTDVAAAPSAPLDYVDLRAGGRLPAPRPFAPPLRRCLAAIASITTRMPRRRGGWPAPVIVVSAASAAIAVRDRRDKFLAAQAYRAGRRPTGRDDARAATTAQKMARRGRTLCKKSMSRHRASQESRDRPSAAEGVRYARRSVCHRCFRFEDRASAISAYRRRWRPGRPRASRLSYRLRRAFHFALTIKIPTLWVDIDAGVEADYLRLASPFSCELRDAFLTPLLSPAITTPSRFAGMRNASVFAMQ